MQERIADQLMPLLGGGILENMNVEVIGFERLIEDYPNCSDFGELYTLSALMNLQLTLTISFRRNLFMHPQFIFVGLLDLGITRWWCNWSFRL